MDEKQLKQTSDNLKQQQPEVESIGSILKSLLFDKCENCGTRPKAAEGKKVKKWCQVCIDRYRHKWELRPSKILYELTSNIGEAYLDAEIGGVDIGDQLLAAEGDIFLHGDIGVGKTWAMAALLKHYLCEGYSCKRINFDEFCCQVRATMNNNSTVTEYDLITKLVKVDKLFIDDIGLRSKRETDFAYITFYSILNKRQERRLPTYISTNKTIDQLSRSFDSRIASRLSFATIIEMIGKDRRTVTEFKGD